jgi:hypothetical protein
MDILREQCLCCVCSSYLHGLFLVQYVALLDMSTSHPIGISFKPTVLGLESFLVANRDPVCV